MFSQTVEYALRAVIAIAERRDAAMKTRDISELTKVPVDYLFKVLRTLAAAGILKGGRGAHGGFTLAKPADAISVLDVINAIDPIQRICSCPLDLPAHRHQLCPLHKRMDDALGHVEEALRASSIATILSETPGGTFGADTGQQRRGRAKTSRARPSSRS